MKKSLLILFAIITTITLHTQAEDFSAVNNGDTIYYNITSSTSPLTVEVTYRGSSYSSYSNEYSGAVSIPDSVLYSGNYYKVTSIGYLAFIDCSGLTSITIPSSVISIGGGAFSSCTSLTSITIPNSVTSIGSGAFSNCTGLTSITIPNSVTSIGDNAFSGCSGLTSISIPNSVTSIGSSAFSGCSGLTSISIPNSVTSIGVFTFSGCSGLTSIELPNSITSIGGGAFYGCSGLTSITIPNSVISIGSSAFYGCSGLTSISIPNSVTLIGEWAFAYCSGLTSIICQAINPPAVQGNSFLGVSKTIPLYVPCNSIPSYNSALYWSDFTNNIGIRAFQLIDTSICKGQTYTSNGFNNNLTGLYSQNLNTINGCDSLIILNLFVNPTYNDTIFAEICPGETYSQFGFNKSATGFYTQSLQTFKGCDSIINLSLIVNPIYNDTIIAEICTNETYTLNGFNESNAGFYTRNLQTIKGCDSIVNLSLFVNPIYIDTIFAEICQGETYSQYGFNVNSSGLHTQSLQAINGCDSVVNLSLDVNPTPNKPLSLVIYQMTNYFELTWQGNSSEYDIYRNDSLIANVSQPIYLDNNLLNGTPYCYKVKARIGDCESEFSDLACKSFVGLEDISQSNLQVKLYPNPSDGKAILNVEGLNTEADVLVYDMVGRVIQKHRLNKGTTELDIDLSGYAKGVYSVRIVNDSVNQTLKLIVR